MGLKPGHLSGFGGSSEVIWGGPLATSALCIIRGGIFASANLPIEIDNDMYSSKQDISGGITLERKYSETFISVTEYPS